MRAKGLNSVEGTKFKLELNFIEFFEKFRLFDNLQEHQHLELQCPDLLGFGLKERCLDIRLKNTAQKILIIKMQFSTGFFYQFRFFCKQKSK